MAATLTLEGRGGSLIIEVAVSERGWSRCCLPGRERIYLGAETADVLFSKLLEAVAEDLPLGTALGRIHGYPVHWVLSLSESHYVLYVADDGAERLLLWQDADQNPVSIAATLRLSFEQRRQWKNQIETALSRYLSARARQVAITKEIAEIVGGAEALK
jgi:hypothetical protein